MTRTLIVALALAALISPAGAEPAAKRAKKTAQSTVTYLMKVYKVVGGTDCKAALERIKKFGAEPANTKTRDSLAAEYAAAKEDEEYGAALQTEMKKAESKLKSLKRPACTADEEVRLAIREALPPGM